MNPPAQAEAPKFPRSHGVEFWHCGWGYDGGFFPRVRLGFVVIGWYRGSLSNTAREMRDELMELRSALADAIAEIKRLRGRG